MLSGFFYILPFIVSNVYYVDDYRRSFGDYYGWEKDGRPLANFFMFLLTYSNRGVDIFPLPILLSLPILALSGIIICRNVFYKESLIKKVIISLPILINPFFLNNLSFRFDCWTMAIAQLMATIAALSYREKTITHYAIRLLILTAILSTYQASMDFYISLCFLFYILSILNNKSFQNSSINFIKDLSLAAFSFAIYKISVLPFINFKNYSKQHSSFIIIDENFFHTLIQNIKMFLHLLLTVPKPYMFSIIAMFVFSIFLSKNDDGNFKISKKIMIFCSLVFFLFFTPGLCLLLNNPVVSYRVLLGFPPLVMFLFYLSFHSNLKFIGSAFIVLNLFSTISTCYAYGNALTAQNAYRDILANEIFSKLLENGYKKNDKIVMIGNEPISPASIAAIKSNRTLANLMPTMLGDSAGWGYWVLPKFGAGYNPPSATEQASAKESISGRKPDYSDIRFSLYKEDQYFVININDEK